MVEMCRMTHGKENLMGQQVPAQRGEILRLAFYFMALPKGWGRHIVGFCPVDTHTLKYTAHSFQCESNIHASFDSFRGDEDVAVIAPSAILS